jgi:hypothetical protein
MCVRLKIRNADVSAALIIRVNVRTRSHQCPSSSSRQSLPNSSS